MLTVIVYLFAPPQLWRGAAYGPEHVVALRNALRANLAIEHRFVCITDRRDFGQAAIETHHPGAAEGAGWHVGCHRRLRAFDPDFQRSIGGSHILSVDLDVAILGDVTPIVRHMLAHDFIIMEGSRQGSHLLSRYNGSLWLCRSGARPHFWRDFVEPGRPPPSAGVVGTDQAWLSRYKGEVTVGLADGVVQYRALNGLPPSPADRMVFFAGSAKPWDEWVRRDVREAWERYAP